MGRSNAQHTGSTASASAVISFAIKGRGTVRDSLEFEHMIPPNIAGMVIMCISKSEESVSDVVLPHVDLGIVAVIVILVATMT